MPDERVSGRIGLCGRLRNPRKNLEPLLTAVHLLEEPDRSVNAPFMGWRTWSAAATTN